MNVSNSAALCIVALVLLGLLVLGGCGKNKGKDEKFTRTCLTADTNCKFVRSAVDYISANDTSGVERMPHQNPHWIGNPTDELQPLADGPVNLIKDEDLLWNQKKLYEQYTHDYKGCGNGKPYIVNDDKTRWELREVGDEWAARALESQRLPQHGPPSLNPAIVDQDLVQPDGYSQLYGGSSYLNQMIGR